MATRLLKVKGTKLFYKDYDNAEHLLTGEAVEGTLGGNLKVKGIYLHYEDNDGTQRRLLGILTGETGTAGRLRIKGKYIRYIDNNGDERWVGFRIEDIAGRGINYRSNAGYNAVHDNATGTVSTTYIGVMNGDPEASNYRRISRAGLIFDTSAVPVWAVINFASIYFTRVGLVKDPEFDLVVVRGEDLTDPIVSADYGDLLDETISRGSISSILIGEAGAGIYAWSIPLNEIGISEIVKGGETAFGLRHSRDISKTAPSGTDGQVWVSRLIGQRAKLVIDY